MLMEAPRLCVLAWSTVQMIIHLTVCVLLNHFHCFVVPQMQTCPMPAGRLHLYLDPYNLVK